VMGAVHLQALLAEPRVQVLAVCDVDRQRLEAAKKAVDEWAAKGYPIKYIHRADRKGYKAGALAEAMKEATGEYIAIFDADFIPPRDMLQNVVNYFTDGKSAYVKVGIIVNELEHIDYLPVMDFRNNAIPIEKVTAMDVNKTIQRSTAKAIAMHGLGLSLWTGEDIPEMTTTAPAKAEAAEPTLTDLKKDTENWDRVVKYIEANKELGLEKVGKQLARKYKMSPAIKKEIANLFNS
jgi:hypothetical protein